MFGKNSNNKLFQLFFIEVVDSVFMRFISVLVFDEDTSKQITLTTPGPYK
jgi:hypothetical protein